MFHVVFFQLARNLSTPVQMFIYYVDTIFSTLLVRRLFKATSMNIQYTFQSPSRNILPYPKFILKDFSHSKVHLERFFTFPSPS